MSAALAGTSHLIRLVAFYLSVRLPAEIMTGDRHNPLPTILPPAASYLGTKTEILHLKSDSAAQQSRFHARPRPLTIGIDDPDATITSVAKKDPAAFSLYLEGISMLAWDLAWLRRSQGLTGGTEDWESICNMGRNLWQMLLSPPQSTALMRMLPHHDVRNRSRSPQATVPVTDTGHKPDVKIGDQSHASAHSFLGRPGAQAALRDWKLTKHTLVADALKKALWAEMSNAEWEILQEQEWDDGGEQFGDEAVVVRTRGLNDQSYLDSRSIMTAHSRIESTPNNIGEAARPKGTSGWTKVKSREKG